MKLLCNYEKDGRPLEELADEDQFMLRFGKIPRLNQRINTLTFIGNFPETVKRLRPVGLGKVFQAELDNNEMLTRCISFYFIHSN